MTENAISIFFLLFSCIYAFYARELSFGTVEAPKAGFLPMLAGSVAVLLSAVVVAGRVVQKQCEEKAPINWRKLIFVAIGLVVYLILLQISGYAPATFIIMFYLLKVNDTAGWIYPCAIAAGSAIGFYLIFQRFLGTNLP